MVKLSQRKGGVFTEGGRFITEEGRGFHRGRNDLSQRKGGIFTEVRNYHRGREGFSQRKGGVITEGGPIYHRGREGFSQRKGGIITEGGRVSQRKGGVFTEGGLLITAYFAEGLPDAEGLVHAEAERRRVR